MKTNQTPYLLEKDLSKMSLLIKTVVQQWVEEEGVKPHDLVFLCIYSVHLNRTFMILIFYHIPNITQIPLMNCKI